MPTDLKENKVGKGKKAQEPKYSNYAVEAKDFAGMQVEEEISFEDALDVMTFSRVLRLNNEKKTPYIWIEFEGKSFQAFFSQKAAKATIAHGDTISKKAQALQERRLATGDLILMVTMLGEEPSSETELSDWE